MNLKIARALIRLYPRPWRERYGDEFEAILLDSESSLTTAIDIALAGFQERIFPTLGGKMNRDSASFGAVVRNPSALVPMAMSLAALAVIFCHIVFHGVAPEADEGPTAHIWQILMAGQLPLLLFFAVKWIPRAPRPALGVLALQAGAVLASMAPVFYFHW